MDEPREILTNGTHIRTHANLSRQGGGFIISDRHLDARKPDANGVIHGIVAGHGVDVYWVAHLGGLAAAAYGWWEFELAVRTGHACEACLGTGVDNAASKGALRFLACHGCEGSGETPAYTMSLAEAKREADKKRILVALNTPLE